MWHPAHLDGRRLVVLRPRGGLLDRYDVVAAGRLSHDGEALRLVESESSTVLISDADLGSVKPVTAANRIPECRGFDFFLIRSTDLA